MLRAAAEPSAPAAAQQLALRLCANAFKHAPLRAWAQRAMGGLLDAYAGAGSSGNKVRMVTRAYQQLSPEVKLRLSDTALPCCVPGCARQLGHPAVQLRSAAAASAGRGRGQRGGEAAGGLLRGC